MTTTLRSYQIDTTRTLEIAQGDITTEKVDAIVNAANARLNHGGGVAFAIAQKGGPIITEESKKWVEEHGPVSHEEPAFTAGGNLPCRYVIHAVGPLWGEGEEDHKLAAAILGALHRASTLRLKSIALPALSTGIYGFPVDRAAMIFFSAIRTYNEIMPESTLKQIRITLFDASTASIFTTLFDAAYQVN